jgi:hypothetical protein
MRPVTESVLKIFSRLPPWLRGCLIGGALGGVAFLTFVAFFALTPLHLLVAAFAAWGASGPQIFSALALPATLLGQWRGAVYSVCWLEPSRREAESRLQRKHWCSPGG